MTKPRNYTEMSYLLENIPRDLWTQAKQKALRTRSTMKQVLMRLLSAWVEEPDERPENS